jgi:hypothetical protein
MPDTVKLSFADVANGYDSNLRAVRGVEIFKVGEWNGDKYTTDDIDQMIAAFGSQGYGVPLKLGHDEVSGGQAYGWVERIYRVGDTLKADFKDIPAWVFQWVFIDHAYDQVSIEIYFNLKRDGKTFKRALKAVALLGAETPAVSGLAPLREAMFTQGAEFEQVLTYSAKVTKMPDPVKPDNSAEIAALTAKLSDATSLVSTLQAQITAQNEQLASISAQFATLTAERTANEIAAKLAAVKVPAIREHMRHIYQAVMGKTDVVKFAAASGTVDKAILDVVDELVAEVNKFADSLTGKPALTTRTTRTAPVNGAADAGVELAEATRAYMAEHSLPPAKYGEAMQKVLASNKELRERYSALASGLSH